MTNIKINYINSSGIGFRIQSVHFLKKHRESCLKLSFPVADTIIDTHYKIIVINSEKQDKSYICRAVWHELTNAQLITIEKLEETFSNASDNISATIESGDNYYEQ